MRDLAKSLKRQIKIETDDFDKFQQQRDQINYHWKVEKKTLEDKKSERRHKDRQQQDLEEKHQVDIKLYKQSVKHLMHEHRQEITERKTELEMSLKLLEDEHRQGQSELKEDRRGLKGELKHMELSHEDYLKSLKQAHDKNISSIRREFERKGKELQKKFDKKMKEVRTRLETQRKRQTQRIEENKNAHIARLMNEHEEAFAQIKAYYHDITHNNLDVIKGLKEDVQELTQKAAKDQKKYDKIKRQNTRMIQPLKKALADVEYLRKQVKEYKKDKSVLDTYKGRLLANEGKMNKLKWKTEVLEQRFVGVKVERDQLDEQFQKAIHSVKQKSSFKNLLIEKKLSAMNEQLEKAEAEMGEILSHANLDKAAMKGGKDVIEQKNQTVRDLQQRLQEMISTHNHMVQHYEDKMLEYGIPVEELGFMPHLFKPSDFDPQFTAAQ